MSPGDLLTLFAAMLALAALPSTSVALVVARSAMGGLRQGIAVAFGIVMGDLVFVAIALLGLAALAEQLGGFFVLVRLLGGLYLLWLGGSLLFARTDGSTQRPSSDPSPGTSSGLFGSFLTGWLLTLGDLKAILFYASLFPLVVRTDQLGAADMLVIMAITAASVGGVKLLYAFAARKLVAIIQDARLRTGVRRGAGALLLGAGGSLMATTAG